VAISYNNSPFRTFNVERSDDCTDPFAHSQFQPPSAMRRLRNQRARWLTSTLSHAPFASVNALMQQSTSPFQYGRLFPTAVGCRTGGGIAQRCRIDAPLTKHIQRPRRRYPRLTLNFGALEIPVFREVCPARPLSVWILKLQQSCSEAFLWDAGSRRLPNLSRRANQVPLHLHRSTGSESSSQTMIAGVTCTLTSLHRALGSGLPVGSESVSGERTLQAQSTTPCNTRFPSS
jgi:hypothetical protein